MSAPLPQALIVCSHSAKIALIKRALKGIYHVIEVQSQSSALDWLTHEQIRLIILDQKSLSSEWVSLCAHIRNLALYSKTPLLLISSNHKKTFYLDALNQGITDLMTEPLDADEITRRVLSSAQGGSLDKKIALVSKKFNTKTTQTPLQPSLNKRVILTEENLQSISHAFASRDPLCLLMLEIDQWHKMERAFSEEGLKELEAQIETFLKKHVRKQDLFLPQEASRFLILLPKTSHRAGMLIAENLRTDAAKELFQLNAEDLVLTFSIGCTAHDKKQPPSENLYSQFEELLNKVTLSLKKAQRKGNRIITDKD